MPTSNLTEDVEFLTDVDSNNRLIRRPRFIRRPRRVGGRNVPGHARYYRRRERELGARPRTAERLANRRAAQRAAGGGRRAAATARRAGAGRGAQTAPPAGGERRGGVLNRLRSAAGRLARNVESRARQRRERRNR